MNILTFDIEEWFLEKKNHGGREFRYQQFDDYLSRVLDLLDEVDTKATFFCLGKVAFDFPSVIRKISDRGHEIGCHSNEHLWLNTMTPEELKKDTYEAIGALEDIIGTKVQSYRAPAFSIGEKNKWALEILAENGITRDASIYPAVRDFGGFASFMSKVPAIIKYNGIQIKEFPISTTKFYGKEITYSGGGYFRFLPYGFVKKNFSKSEYSIAYFHLGDLIMNPNGMMSKEEYEKYYKELGTMKNRVIRYVKSSMGTAKAFDKMAKLISNFKFINVDGADAHIDWNSAKMIEL
jgi:polysaccharide deacetylase family protein (PEP-CTERM system associated)